MFPILMNNFKKSKDVNTLNRLRDLLELGFRDNEGLGTKLFNAGDIDTIFISMFKKYSNLLYTPSNNASC